MNTNIYNRDEFYKKVINVLKTDEDKDKCLRLLTNSENNTLCHGVYNATYINSAIESADYIIIRHKTGEPYKVVGFALLKLLRSKALDILMVCTIPNSERYGNMMAYDIHSFAILKKCKKIYTSPRTLELRNTFFKYGFEHLRGIENVDEVLVRKLAAFTIIKTNTTRKVHKTSLKTSRKVRLATNSKQNIN
jgi:hypothetical protein